MRKICLLLSILAVSLASQAQEKWGLLKCVEYAWANNISIKQTDLQSKLAELQLKQSKLGQLPNLNLSGNTGYSNGRNQDPTTFSLITQGYLSAGMQLQSSADIFNWFSKRNTVAANEWELLAAKANTDKLKNDIALTVANSYLQILLAIEQEKIAGLQLEQSKEQLRVTRIRVDAGALPELNASELEAQVARDSSTLISAKGNVQQAKLTIKAYMGLDAGAPFDVDTPPVEKIPVEKIADLQPDAVYASAIANMPQQKFNDFKLKAAEKTAKAAKGSMYPTLSAYGSLGSSYNNRTIERTGITSLASDTIAKVNVGGTLYNVFTDFPVYSTRKQPFFSQLNQNFRQSVGLSLSIPIFNGYNARTSYERSRISTRNWQLQKDLDNQSLKQNIYQAYNAAMVALEKFNAGKKSLETAERTYSFAQKRYDVGLMSTFELITNQNNVFRARLENALNQYDYVFKMKVLEFYKGLGIKL